MKAFGVICLGAVVALSMPVLAFGYLILITSLATLIP